MLTKSDYITYLDSPLHLWALKNNQYERKLSDFDKHLIKQGYEVETLAREYVKKYISKDTQYQKIYQTDDLFARADIVVGHDIYEVKSSTEISKEDEHDISFQYYLAKTLGQVDNIYLIHLNKDYIRGNKLDLKELFVIEDMTSLAKKRWEYTEATVAEALLISNKDTPQGLSPCYNPKTCPSKALCFPDTLPEYSIYDVSRISKKHIDALREMGIVDMRNIPSEFNIAQKQKLQIEATKKDKIVIDEKKILSELDNLQFPIYFLDYETYSWAVPQFEGHKPYENVVFQFSLHILKNKNGNLSHYEYIAITKKDPILDVLNILKDVIGDNGSILVWNKTFEKGCNEEMARIYPQYEQFLLNLNRRIYDLGDIFKYQMYIDPQFKGSWSIKNVLPVLAPDLNYHDMEIGKGDEAMVNWYRLSYERQPQEETESTKKNLLKYCELDTYAMYRIYDFLVSKVF